MEGRGGEIDKKIDVVATDTHLVTGTGSVPSRRGAAGRPSATSVSHSALSPRLTKSLKYFIAYTYVSCTPSCCSNVPTDVDLNLLKRYL